LFGRSGKGYAGNFPLPPEADGLNVGHVNPRIDLDNGKAVWGFESWWGPPEQVRMRIPPGWRWVTIDIDEHRACAAAVEHKS